MSQIVEMALSQYGVKEIPGDRHNKDILKYFSYIGHDWVKDDETAWCSCFMNFVAKMCDKPMSNKLNARSWLLVGEEPTVPQQGDVVIFWRESPDSWKGHVGIYINEIGDDINVLGGNQNNSVCIKPYPKERLLGYRRL
jgi:uncharacterized protein (TIGR02594 family)